MESLHLKKLALLSFAALGIASLTQAASASSIAEQHGWTPVFTSIPRAVDLRAGRRPGSVIQTFTSSIKSPLDNNTYNFTIVGTDPTTPLASTSVLYEPIAIKWHFPGGVVIDPTKPGCGDTVSVVKRFFKGPNFASVPLTSNGISVGTTQVNDAFQIAEFWKYTQAGGYHVLLTNNHPTGTIVVSENAPAGSTLYSGACAGSNHDLGAIPINSYDSLLSSLAAKYTTSSNVIPIILSYNIVETSGGCCIIGYHSVRNGPTGPQPYATGAYTDAGIFSGIQDIHAWTHEIGELFNDPYINNATPAWGHVGQVSGCQNNLEVGDPLTGTPFLVNYNGFTYHPQELAYFSWFFRQSPSIGTGGKYSFEGSFSSAQGACH